MIPFWRLRVRKKQENIFLQTECSLVTEYSAMKGPKFVSKAQWLVTFIFLCEKTNTKTEPTHTCCWRISLSMRNFKFRKTKNHTKPSYLKVNLAKCMFWVSSTISSSSSSVICQTTVLQNSVTTCNRHESDLVLLHTVAKNKNIVHWQMRKSR
jgi:hypothetical protein